MKSNVSIIIGAMSPLKPRWFWILGLLSLLIVATPSWGGQYSAAKRHGRIDLSYGCPAGSYWDPRGGGECRACPAGSSMVLFECRRAIAPIAEKAIYVYHRHNIFQGCRKGTFPAGVTTKCYRCRRGLLHNGALPVEVPGVCFRPPEIKNLPARVVAKVTPAQLIDPHRVIGELSKLGCARYGKGVFFDPRGGGSCWSCPASHPTRTLYPVNTARACATRTCGTRNGRPCYLWERIPSCNKGLIENPLTNTCVPPPDIGCLAMVSTAKAVFGAVRKAQKAGKALSAEQLRKIPGLGAVLRFVENQMAQVDKQMQKTLTNIPVDKAVGALRHAIPTPEAAARINRVLSELSRRRSRIENAMLNAGEVCSGNPKTLKHIFQEALDRSVAQVDHHHDWGKVFGVAKAQAGEGFPIGWSFGISLEPTVNLILAGKLVPVQLFGLEFVVHVVGPSGHLVVAPYLTFGADLLRYPSHSDELASVDGLVSVQWPHTGRVCPIEGVGAGLVVGDRFGFGIDCTGVKSVSVRLTTLNLKSRPAKKPAPPSIVVTNPEGNLVEHHPSPISGAARGTKPAPAIAVTNPEGAVVKYHPSPAIDITNAAEDLHAAFSATKRKGHAAKIFKKEFTLGPNFEINLHPGADGSTFPSFAF